MVDERHTFFFPGETIYDERGRAWRYIEDADGTRDGDLSWVKVEPLWTMRGGQVVGRPRHWFTRRRSFKEDRAFG